jgi:hypothetical protein
MAKVYRFTNGVQSTVATGLTVGDAARNSERWNARENGSAYSWEAETPAEQMAAIEAAAAQLKLIQSRISPTSYASTLRTLKVAWKQAQAEDRTAGRVAAEVAAAVASADERAMRAAEAEADRAGTLRDEQAREEAEAARALNAYQRVQVAVPAPRTFLNGLQAVANGLYTVVKPEGGHVTFRVCDDWRADARPGSQVVKVLTGSANETDYTGFAFLGGTNLTVWKKFRGGAGDTWARLFRVVQQDAQAAGEAYALASGNCYRCNRTLTVPASIHRGLGPDCAKKVGA